jgi:glutathione S-transferase
MSEIRLCGFAASNYYNKVKLALLEKGVPFEEELVYPSKDPLVLADSPMGKVLFLRLPGGTLAESQAIVEYIEDRFPPPPLYPADPLARARVRELIELIELHLELPARRVYGEAFFGGKASDDTRAEVRALLGRGLAAFGRLAKFEPYVAGPDSSHVDCAAMVHLPLVSGVGKRVFGVDLVAEAVPRAPAHLKEMAGRPFAKKVNAERKAAMDAFIAFRRAREAR